MARRAVRGVELADAQRREIFAFIPGGEAGNSSIALILPDSLSDFQSVAV